MHLRRAISAIAVSTFALSGCSTSYAPKPNPRVAVIMQGGTPVYIREGRVFPGGGFGGDLHEAVQGNAEAESHAKAYRTGMIAGVTTVLAGAASAVGGGILYFSNANGPESERSGTAEAVGGTLFLSGIAAYVTGMVFLLNAQPHLWDAINAYNDGVEAGGPPRVNEPLAPPPAGAYMPLPPGALPLGAAYKGKLPPPSDGSSLPSPTPPAPASPPAISEAAPNAAAPSAPAPALLPAAAPAAPAPPPAVDIDLDKVDAETK